MYKYATMGAPATTCAPWAVAMVPWAHSSEATDCTDDLHAIIPWY